MASELLVIAAAAAAVAYLLARKPNLADNILWARSVLFGVAGVVFAFILIGTGVPALQFVGFLALLIGFLWLFREQPYSELR